MLVEAAGVEPASEKAHRGSLRACPVRIYRPPRRSRQARRRPSPIVLGLGLRTEALRLSRQMTLANRLAGQPAGAAA